MIRLPDDQAGVLHTRLSPRSPVTARTRDLSRAVWDAINNSAYDNIKRTATVRSQISLCGRRNPKLREGGVRHRSTRYAVPHRASPPREYVGNTSCTLLQVRRFISIFRFFSLYNDVFFFYERVLSMAIDRRDVISGWTLAKRRPSDNIRSVVGRAFPRAERNKPEIVQSIYFFFFTFSNHCWLFFFLYCYRSTDKVRSTWRTSVIKNQKKKNRLTRRGDFALASH